MNFIYHKKALSFNTFMYAIIFFLTEKGLIFILKVQLF